MDFLYIVFPIFFAIISTFFIYAGLSNLIKEKRIRKKWRQTNGTIVDLLVVKGRRRRAGNAGFSTYFRPVVEYQTHVGSFREKNPDAWTKTPFSYEVGQTVPVVYNPEAPAEFRIVNDAAPQFAFFICTFIGVVGIAISIIILMVHSLD